jgi:hypothetical protein
MSAAVETYLRSEVEVAANAVWSLIAAGLVTPSASMVRICEVTGLSLDELQRARLRADRVPPGRLKPSTELARPVAPAPPSILPTRTRHPLSPTAYDRQPIPKPGDKASMRLTNAGRRGAADAVFAMWRARGELDCTRCGTPIHSGEDAVIEAAHHAGCPQ